MKRNESKNICLYYFGADMPWEELVVHGFRRRNTCFLQSIVNNKDVSKVFVVRQSTRGGVLKNILKSKKVTNKVVDVFITTLLPERKWLPLSKQINKLLTSFLFLIQTGRFSKSTDIIWIYWIAAYLFARKIDIKGRYIFDVDHNIIGDDNLPDSEKDRVANILVDIGNKCEFILSSSRSMIRWFEDKGITNCLTARNGIDPSRFMDNLPEPNDLTNIKHPRILYVGTLSKWIDTELLVNLIKKHPEWNFIFIGGNYKTGLSADLDVLSNVTMLGFKLADEVPAYMQNVDIALGMYRDIEWLDVDSMKFYEYLAAKVPVVSTNYHSNINSDFSDLIPSCNKLTDLEKMIDDVLNQNDKLKKEWRDRTMEFVTNNTWDNRIAQIINSL
ncbi:MAG: glycosyltransferase [Bacteroidota bacterium]